ncbi:MAG TPA: sugar transferase [Bacteroidales bacterium]|nr:MAG: polyprenyl glycosylphosphotransferase [Bacteroidetes bacterium GWF2_33_38]OFY86939.1 MAG: polyprenyl glycosylphosphotransferase [Bacteroidetes bacterium RIFOXYA2_FULL_33_7]HBF87453.1 sugar transferase [Bacteroidales bacterium]
MNKRLDTFLYVFFDILSSTLAWTLFFIFRKIYVEPQKFGYDIPVYFDKSFYLGLVFIPLFWVLLYYTNGYYKKVYRRSRLKELGQTILLTLIGVVLIFFMLILDDTVYSYKTYYFSFSTLLGLHFVLTYIPRIILSTRIIHKIREKTIYFNTLIIGSNEKALNLFLEFESKEESTGNNFVGFISIHDKEEYLLGSNLSHLGKLSAIKEIIAEKKVEEVVVAIESSEHDEINKIIQILDETNVIIKVIPDMYDILTGSVKMSNIFDAPLIQISHDLMPAWQENLKRVIDVFVSILALTVFSPVYLALIVGVKMSSKGPIFYSHERIGIYGKPFMIYKFRSMFVGSEQNGPALSSKNDSRITRFGLFMRKTRLDEMPQFYNVLKGDMSLVGPRPERQYFIDQIVQRAPHYFHLQKVRPGITSWGQVKYGYAENVDQMIERLKYDIIYIENMSLYVDFKIMIYTISIILGAKGK